MELIFGILGGFASGGFFGVFAMAVLSGRAYEKGRNDVIADAYNVYNQGYDHGYDDGEKHGYSLAARDATTVAGLLPDEVVFRGPDHTKIEGD